MRALVPWALLAVMACTGDTEDKTDTTDATDATDATDVTDGETTGDTGKEVVMYNITASVVDASNLKPIIEPLCGELLEITAVVLDPENGEFTVLASATSSKGEITFSDIDVKPDVPMLINLNDCKGKDAPKTPIVGISSNTGVLPASYKDAKNGETVSATAFVVTPTFLGGLQASLVAAGDTTTDLSKSGWLHGLALAADGSSPVAGVTVTCKGCDDKKTKEVDFPTYYMDAVSADGLFTTASKTGLDVNASTQAGVGVWVVPSAPVSNYSATDTNAKLTFPSQLGGSFPGSVIVTAFVAE